MKQVIEDDIDLTLAHYNTTYMTLNGGRIMRINITTTFKNIADFLGDLDYTDFSIIKMLDIILHHHTNAFLFIWHNGNIDTYTYEEAEDRIKIIYNQHMNGVYYLGNVFTEEKKEDGKI